MTNFEQRLTGGHPNSLGNTIEIVTQVLDHPEQFPELFNCYFSTDEIVRLRVSNAMKRICREKKSLIIPYIDRLINEISLIDQASTQWTLAQLFGMLEKDMTTKQIEEAKKIMKHNLAHHNDWIVLNFSMETLTNWSQNDPDLRKWILPHLQRLASDSRRSVANRAKKFMAAIG